MKPELHAFFLDPAASAHAIHADIVLAYRRMCGEAGEPRELIAWSDEFEGLLDDVRDHVRNPDEDADYLARLTEFRDELGALYARRERIEDLGIEIRQRLEEREDLLDKHDRNPQAVHDYQSWQEARDRTLAEVERLRADPDMAPHIDHALTNLPELAATLPPLAARAAGMPASSGEPPTETSVNAQAGPETATTPPPRPIWAAAPGDATVTTENRNEEQARIAEHRAARSAARTYDPASSCVFRFTQGDWGIFSNFAPLPKPVAASDHAFRTSEHLYQAAKFRESPEVQSRIARATSARDAANIGRHAENRPDADWNDRRINAMRWVIRMKREANPALIDAALQKTGDLPIVEHAGTFWGTRPEGEKLVGQNILGRLWMELRQQIRAGDPRAKASAWEDPISSKAAVRETGAALTGTAPSAYADRQEHATDAPDTWQHIKAGYASLYRASGERLHHLPHQEGFTELVELVAGAVRDGSCPSRYRDRLEALNNTLQTQNSRYNTVLAARDALDDASARLAGLKQKIQAGHAIETMPGYTAWLRERDAAVETWRKLSADPAHKDHLQAVAPDMMAPRIAELSNDNLPSIHRVNQSVPASGQGVYTPSLQPLARVWDRALAFADRDPRLLAYAPQFDELKDALSTAFDECRHVPDLLDKLTTLRTALDDSHEYMTHARAASEDVANASRTLCGMKAWSERTGRPIHEAPNFRSGREDADRALKRYEEARKDPAIALHLARADTLGVLAESALPLLQDPRFREPAISEAALARQRSEQAGEQYSMSA